ncbi:DUF2267 domain-containing protein [Hoeflea sp. TYP-13]|uniref:DUF2267 domain-containing protein n=1 Tax=Hoeflea sp. TYP-13 TaxID=3230023 RepID=UPI0034C5E8F1
MNITGIKTLDHAPNVVQEWLNVLRDTADLPESQQAYMLLRATLHAVRDWLSVDEAAQLSAQLPILIRGIYFEGWNPSSTPVHPRNKEAFLQRVNAGFTKDPLPDDEGAVTAVFALLKDHVSPGEIDDVVQAMPKDIRRLWP